MEFIVIKDGELWSDGFYTESDAENHIIESSKRFRGVFEILKVTEEDLENYYKE